MIIFEHTDTYGYGGEANYSWVKRETYTGKAQTDLAIIRAAKKFAGISGVPCRKENFGDMVALYPQGMCQVVFVMWM